ncbi:glycerophosphodiester phosphodiesterase family protein [Caldilinea sp.]|jgi:glycerophosphoryl diester phosphodiesterase|uniref:glycerophosphodiester phosphodiesterase family protein n=1 Tax=Caldilinea sp. TaxID=2293560 RepID=UPI002626CC22|nr:glycerophosphodiester phosphodiesterase family protein [uncultured Caldilinea sp.]
MIPQSEDLSDVHLRTLLQTEQPEEARSLAARYAPILRFDAREPFPPLAVGYTLFREDGDSPSFPRRIELRRPDSPPAALAIEYAIWWDWDIQHLYELEHVWVFVDAEGRVCRGEASWHGGWHAMASSEGALLLDGDHLIVFSEPGKHAFAPDPLWFHERRDARTLREQTTRRAGFGGVWVTPLFEREIRPLRTPYANTLVRTHLQRCAFEPAWQFTKIFPIQAEQLIPWSALQRWIPERVAGWIQRLAEGTPPEALRFLRIAHRGASAYAAENTLAAFRKAAELGADMVEMDVQLTRDGAAVIFHDLVVDHLTEGRGAVNALSLAQLRKLTVPGPDGSREPIPTLEEAIACCLEHDLGLYIEIKAGGAAPAVVEAMQCFDLKHQAIVGSFRPDWIAAVKQFDPAIPTSVLFSAPNVDPVKLAQAVGADYVHPCWEAAAPQPHRLLTAEWVKQVRQHGLGIILWHEERPEEIAALRQIGVDGVCSNAPDLLLAADI